jgi:hypothetical protein
MKSTNIIAPFVVLSVGLLIAACGGAATSNTSATVPANKTAAATPPTGSPATAAPAKQGTPPKADFTMSAEDLKKDYKALLDKDPKSINLKYENKNVQFTGKITRMYSSETGTGTKHIVMVSGGKDDDASCSFDAETEEFKTLQIGQTVTLQGTITNNQNVPPPLFSCFVIKGAQ